MAITKIHPIKTTIDLSIDYICDKDKTDEEILISSYKCGYKTAALQFNNTRELMNSSSKNLGRHLIQSFLPDEVSAELGHQIGQELCQKHLQDKYEYVITTHVDRGHIHNHIIFNNVSLIDGKAYISNKKSYHQIRRQSDEICLKHGLSTLDNSKENTTKGQSYKEHLERKNGNSYKAKLQYTIDLAIKKSKDYDDFLQIMHGHGYSIKCGKHISFKAKDQQRFTRAKTIGSEYTETRIQERIKSRSLAPTDNRLKRRSSTKVVDISSNKLAAESEGFARWLKLQNLKNMAKAWQTLSDQNITDLSSFNDAIIKSHDDYNQCLTRIKDIEQDIQSTSELLRHMNTVEKYMPLHDKYSVSNNPEAFFQQHEKELILFIASEEALEKLNPQTQIDKETLIGKLNALSKKLDRAKADLTKFRQTVSSINELKSNLDLYLSNLQVKKSLYK